MPPLVYSPYSQPTIFTNAQVCPGAHFAETTAFVNITGILATFDISPQLDASGREVLPDVDYTTGITS